MEWREQSTVSCDEAFVEAQRWIEAVTKKKFGNSSFRSSLENGVLLCDLINNIKPGTIRRVNRLPTPIAGLDNLNVFLKACKKLGLKEAQLFHPGDLQDLSSRVTVKHQETNRRLKNVLITIYWLGRRAHSDSYYEGPDLNLKAFEGLLGTALYKALTESSDQQGSSVRDSGFGDSWYSDREEPFPLRAEGGGCVHRREDSLDSLDSLGSRPHSVASDTTLKGSSEGCCSDTEADTVFRMAQNKNAGSYRRSLVVTPKSATPFNQFLPSKDKPVTYMPAPLRKKRADRHEDNRSSWASPVYTEKDGSFTRALPNSDGSDGSKSMSDIYMEPPAQRQGYYDELQKMHEKQKASDERWQDDLSAWKSRRKSVNSDIVKKKEEREQIEQITSSGSTRRSKTFKEMQEERGTRDRGSIGSRLSSLQYLDSSDDVFAEPVTSPRTRSFPARSYTIDTPYSSGSLAESSSVFSLKEEDPPAATPAPRRASSPRPVREADIVESPAGRDATASTLSLTTARTTVVEAAATSPSPPPTTSPSPPPEPTSYSPEPHPTTITDTVDVTLPSSMSTIPADPNTTTTTTTPASVVSLSSSHNLSPPATVPMERSPSAVQPEPIAKARVKEPRAPSGSFARAPNPRRAEEEAPSSGSLYKQPLLGSTEARPPGVSRVSASLPRSYQKSDSARLTSVVTPKPFGTQSTRLSSLPRFYSQMEESHKRVNGDVNVSKKASVPSRYHQVMTPEDLAPSPPCDSSASEEEEDEAPVVNVIAPAKSISPAPPVVRNDVPDTPAPVKEETHCDMRISLNQKPNSSRDFGFQADWDSTGACVKSIQPGSPAEMCQLKAGDEVLTVNGHRVADMSYTQWKTHMEEALQQGALVMDVRRHGNSTWDRDLPSPPYKSHKVINLTTLDHPILLGAPDANTVNTSLDFTSRISTEMPTANDVAGHPIINMASNGLSRDVREASVTMRSKDSESISLKNLKRRSEFFEQGGSESAVSDIPVPSIIPTSNRYSWDPEEERRRQEKWQREQERLLQEKYKRDQEKLEEEWRRAQEEAARFDSTPQQKAPRSPGMDINTSSAFSQASQPTADDEREEEQRRKEEQEQQRQMEERRKREEEERELQRLQEERQRRQRQEEEERRLREEEEQRWREKREEEERRRQEELVEQQRREREVEQQRAKSKSTSQLDEDDRPDTKVTSGGVGEASWRDAQKKGQAPLSQAELERQQILQEMRKKTPLLTDASWIRQRSVTAAPKEAGNPPMRRGESLDNLDAPRTSWRSSWTPGSTSSIPNYSRPHSALSGHAPSHGRTVGSRPGSVTLPSSYSMGSLRGGAGTPSSLWSRDSLSPSSPSPTTSPEPSSEVHHLQQHSRSVSGKKICTFCDTALGKGAAMIIESLGLCYHLGCFKCIQCKSDLGGSEAGAEVRIRNKQLYCNTCYMRFKTGQPTSM